MGETVEERKSRLAMFARDAVTARSDYQIESNAVLDRTARLKAERLDRESVISLAGPKTPQAASSPRKSALKAKLKASKRRKAI